MNAERPRGFCCDEDLARIGCDGLGWAEDLDKLRDSGPRAETQELLDVLRAEGVEGASLLDIGAGVGAVHLALLEAGAARAVDVDASRDYLAAARSEAERRDLSERVEYRYGDVVELADALPAADIVTADSVICCYPNLGPLLAAMVRGAPRLVGLTYADEAWWLRGWMRLMNAWWAFRRLPDRWYIHRHREVDRLMAEAGYAVIHDGGSWNWRVVVYRRQS
jgi:magnesium-protoporphyrin O-methyltransferase